MKKLLATLFLLPLLPLSSRAITPGDSPVEFYGFVRYEAYLDSYKGLNAANEQFFILPLYAGTDANGKHINQTPTFNFSTMATRLGIRVSGPAILNAKTSANIEADFAGDLASNPAMLRLRQANATFAWPNVSVLVGQTWHPFWGGKIFPTVGSLNTGAPFQPFNRSPQIRIDFRPASVLALSAALVSEFQYKSYGFSRIDSMQPKAMVIEKSECYNRNAALPEMTLNAELTAGGFTLGAGSSLKFIKPTLYTIGISPGKDNKKYVSTQTVKALSLVGYGQYVRNKLAVRAKVVWGQNMTHLTIPGGYGVKSLDPVTGSMSYTPYNTLTSFVNVVYGKTYQVGLFAGYLENRGTAESLYNFGTESAPVVVTPGLVPNVASIQRIAPHVALNISKLRLVLEYELTAASYGTGAINPGNGLYDHTTDATNHRGLLMLMYSF